MAFTFKSISSEGGSGGGGGGSSDPYVATFSSGSWSVSGSNYIYTILESTHGKGTDTQVKVYETVGMTFEEVGTGVRVNASGDITLIITLSPDNRFSGKIVIL